MAKHWLLPAIHLCSANVFDVAIVFAKVLDVSILDLSSAGREGFLQTFGIGVSNTTKLFVCGIRFSLSLKGKFMLEILHSCVTDMFAMQQVLIEIALHEQYFSIT